MKNNRIGFAPLPVNPALLKAGSGADVREPFGAASGIRLPAFQNDRA